MTSKLIRLLLILISFGTTASLAQAQHSVSLTWTDTTSGVTYNMYRATGACASGLVFSKLNSTAITATAYTDASSLTAGTTYCYQVTAVNSSGVESIPSNEAPAVIPNPPPAPTGLTVGAVN
jgi:fibronectin type 3 domain-containing protein